MTFGGELKQIVRRVLGLRDADAQELWRLGLYRAEVKAQASDGLTVDVQPEDPRIPSIQGIPVRWGIPGTVAHVGAGAVVLLGWEKGDPERPYAVPSWESGLTVSKLVVTADMVYLGAEGGAEALVKKSEFDGHTHSVPASGLSLDGMGGITGTATAAAPTAITGTTNVKAV